MNLKKVQAQRMYYLVQRTKKYIPVKAWDRSVEVPIEKVQSIPQKAMNYINELIERFHYSFQLTIW